MSDSDWRAWKEATFGNDYMIWHDGLPTGAVTGLTGEEREKALQMLRLGVSEGDSHAAEALAAMGDASTLSEMRRQLEEAGAVDRVRLALAIHQVEPDNQLAQHLIMVLFAPIHWAFAIDAAMGLRRFSGPQVEEALLEAVAKHPDYLVRYHSADSYLKIKNVTPPDIGQHREILAKLCGPQEGFPTPEHFQQFEEASRMIAAASSAAP